MSQPPSTVWVTIIAESRDTIDGLRAYLSGAGVSSHTAQHFGDVGVLPPAVQAVIVFPDELDPDAVAAGLAALRATHPHVLVVVVTGAPQRLRAVLAPDELSSPPVVLPKPVFGWTILDAIRAHARAQSPP